jgi:hypothetical protein
MTPPAFTLDELARRTTDAEAAFVALFPHPALVLASRVTVPATRDAPGGAPEEDPFRTGRCENPFRMGYREKKTERSVGVRDLLDTTRTDERRSDEGPTPRQGAVVGGFELGGESQVLFLAKSERNPFAHMITVGRASNNDLVFAQPTISKLHAYFRGSPSGWTLTDQKSTNGTFLEETALVPGNAVALGDGVALRFGLDLRARFFSASGLFQLLQRAFRGTGRDATRAADA